MSAVSHDCETRKETLHGPAGSIGTTYTQNNPKHNESGALEMPNLMETLEGQPKMPEFLMGSESHVWNANYDDKSEVCNPAIEEDIFEWSSCTRY